MKIGAAFPSSYLKKEDVGNGMVVTIKDFRIEDVGGNSDPNDNKPVIHFHETDRGLVVNKTNAEIITQIMGTDDTDGWLGRQIMLYNDPNIWFGGKQTGGIRVRPAQATGQPAAQGQPSGVAQPPSQEGPAQAAPPSFQNPSAAASTAQAAATNAQNPAFDDDIPFN